MGSGTVVMMPPAWSADAEAQDGTHGRIDHRPHPVVEFRNNTNNSCSDSIDSWEDHVFAFLRSTRRAALMAAALVLAAGAATAGATTAQSARESAPAAPPRCATADLGVWVAADQAEGAAGTFFFPLEFTNLSQHTCTLFGFPGVSALGRDYQQLGLPAVWDRTVAPHTVRLAPGATAHATLAYGNATVGSCPIPTTPAIRLRVFPPDETSAAQPMWSLDACTDPGLSTFLWIRPIASGFGVGG